MNKKITVAGTGYVGLSLSVLLSQHNDVYAIDVIQSKVDMINAKQSPIDDKEIKDFLQSKELNLTATTDPSVAYKDADYIIIAVPTNYDEQKEYFDTHCIEDVIKTAMQYNTKATFVIKSTIPVGYTKSLQETYEGIDIMFSPEFLREGHALYDNLHPSRIIVGCNTGNFRAMEFAELLEEGAEEDRSNLRVLFMGTTEAEAVKLFANTYLAMRVSFFNELDTYANVKGLNARSIIDGISYDKRIGDYYNNPSFGYGGYCLPKDTKQLLANYRDVPQEMITAIVDSNDTRKGFIINDIIKKAGGKCPTIGIYKLAMKAKSDNFRKSAMLDIMDGLREYYGFINDNIIVFDESIEKYEDYEVYHDLKKFKSECDVIVANRMDYALMDVKEKVYTRDIFGND